MPVEMRIGCRDEKLTWVRMKIGKVVEGDEGCGGGEGKGRDVGGRKRRQNGKREKRIGRGKEREWEYGE